MWIVGSCCDGDTPQSTRPFLTKKNIADHQYVIRDTEMQATSIDRHKSFEASWHPQNEED